MKSTVGIRRAIVEEEGFRIRSVGKLPFVERGGAALQIMVAKLRCWSWSGKLGLAKDGRLGQLRDHIGGLTGKKPSEVLWSTATTST